MEGEINIAVVGLGRMGSYHAGLIASSVPTTRLAAVFDVEEERTRKMSSMYNAKCYTRYEELLEDNTIDAVVIAVPNHQHGEYTCRAAERGLHVLCEKPMATSLEEAAKMIAVCHHRQVKLMIGNMVRFHPCHQ